MDVEWNKVWGVGELRCPHLLVKNPIRTPLEGGYSLFNLKALYQTRSISALAKTILDIDYTFKF